MRQKKIEEDRKQEDEAEMPDNKVKKRAVVRGVFTGIRLFLSECESGSLCGPNGDGWSTTLKL